jgi:deoxyribodipyrimidine photo-lyase
VSQIAWRDFYAQVLWHAPHAARGAWKPAYDAVSWQDDPAGLAAWRAGRTGYPIVDAAARQLLQSGFMHNRARMISASFLSKDLLIDWREGEAHFLRHLVDGDIAANNGGWQWSASTGTDAQPYFRIFNPVTQARNFDPDGAYVRRWVPELAPLSDRAIHAPWEHQAELAAAGIVLGRDYPAPIVDHAAARQRALDAYQTAVGRGTEKGKPVEGAGDEA